MEPTKAVCDKCKHVDTYTGEEESKCKKCNEKGGLWVVHEYESQYYEGV